MVRRLIPCALIAGAAVFWTLPVAAQDAPTAVEIGERRSLHSDVLGEDRAYWVYLPASYDDERYAPQAYPVMYLLDGSAHFHSASGVVQFMSTGINGNIQVPEMIVVAIPNTNRTRDLTPTNSSTTPDGEETPAFAESGGGDEFLRFMREELFPEIESTYRTRPWRLFVGHSFGGLLALHAAVNRPDMFQAYIAIDPSLWWDEQRLLGEAQTYFTETEGLEGSIFVTLANNPTPEPGRPKIMEQAGRAFGWAMEAAASDRFRPGIKYYEGEDHGSVPLISLYEGLLHTFDGYKAPLQAFLENPPALGDHFAALSEKTRHGGVAPRAHREPIGVHDAAAGHRRGRRVLQAQRRVVSRVGQRVRQPRRRVCRGRGDRPGDTELREVARAKPRQRARPPAHRGAPLGRLTGEPSRRPRGLPDAPFEGCEGRVRFYASAAGAQAAIRPGSSAGRATDF